MGRYYFFSGFDKADGFPAEIAESLRTNIIERESLVFIASDPAGYQKTDRYLEGNTRWLREAGVEFSRVDVIDARKNESECAELVGGASAIFLMGGTTLAQMNFLRERDLILLLQNSCAVVMGVSAGAINMAVNAFYSADGGFAYSHIYKGIGLADCSIEPHFSIENKELIEKDILPFSEIIDLYCIRDNGAILVDGETRRVFGEVYLASKRKLTKL